jgi:hypothetical protein
MNHGEQQGLGSFLKFEVFLFIFNRKSYLSGQQGGREVAHNVACRIPLHGNQRIARDAASKLVVLLCQRKNERKQRLQMGQLLL